MKINKIGIMAAFSLAALLVSANFATAQEAKGKRGLPSVQQRLDRLSEELKLTDDQKPKVKAILEETDKKMQELRDAPQDERREKRQTIMADEGKKMKEVLKAEQYETYEKQIAQRRGGAPGQKKGDDKKE